MTLSSPAHRQFISDPANVHCKHTTHTAHIRLRELL